MRKLGFYLSLVFIFTSANASVNCRDEFDELTAIPTLESFVSSDLLSPISHLKRYEWRTLPEKVNDVSEVFFYGRDPDFYRALLNFPQVTDVYLMNIVSTDEVRRRVAYIQQSGALNWIQGSGKTDEKAVLEVRPHASSGRTRAFRLHFPKLSAIEADSLEQAISEEGDADGTRRPIGVLVAGDSPRRPRESTFESALRAKVPFFLVHETIGLPWASPGSFDPQIAQNAYLQNFFPGMSDAVKSELKVRGFNPGGSIRHEVKVFLTEFSTDSNGQPNQTAVVSQAGLKGKLTPIEQLDLTDPLVVQGLLDDPRIKPILTEKLRREVGLILAGQGQEVEYQIDLSQDISDVLATGKKMPPDWIMNLLAKPMVRKKYKNLFGSPKDLPVLVKMYTSREKLSYAGFQSDLQWHSIFRLKGKYIIPVIYEYFQFLDRPPLLHTAFRMDVVSGSAPEVVPIPLTRTNTPNEFRIVSPAKPGQSPQIDVLAQMNQFGLLKVKRLITRPEGTSSLAHVALSGSAAYAEILEHFKGRLNGIIGDWSSGRNLVDLNRLTAINTKMSLAEAVEKTWEGQRAVEAGFTEVTILTMLGSAGSYQRVQVAFTRPGGSASSQILFTGLDF
jgi:hypothetical protein